jgi:hypothetical protein
MQKERRREKLEEIRNKIAKKNKEIGEKKLIFTKLKLRVYIFP